MKKFREISEQHREKGRFKPIEPKMVKSTDVVSPRPTSDSANVKLKEAIKDKFDIGEYDQEGDMAKSDLRSIISNAQKLHDMIDDADNLPEWVQSKITIAEDYISTVTNYMTAEMNEEWSKTGKKATHRETGEKTYEYHEVDKEGKPTGKREYRNAQGKSMGEEVELIDEKNVPTSPEKWAQAKAQAKAKFDVYPSAYANGWAAKKYKAMGGGWKSVSESTEDLKGDSIGAMSLREKPNKEPMKKLKEFVSEMNKADVPAYLRKQKGEKPLTVADVKGPRKDSISHKDNLAKLRGEEVESVEQIDELSKDTLKSYLQKKLNNPSIPTQKDVDGIANSTVRLMGKKPTSESVELEEGVMKRIATDKEENSRLSEPPFDKPYTTSKGTVTDKSGAKHSPMSRARDLARQAVKKQSEYAKARKAGSSTKNAQARAAGANNPHMFEARKAEIVKDIVKSVKKKKEDSESFQKDPELGSTITKNVC